MVAIIKERVKKLHSFQNFDNSLRLARCPNCICSLSPPEIKRIQIFHHHHHQPPKRSGVSIKGCAISIYVYIHTSRTNEREPTVRKLQSGLHAWWKKKKRKKTRD